MTFISDLQKLTADNYIFPVEVYFVGKRGTDGKHYDEFKRSRYATGDDKKVYAVKVDEGKVTSKGTQLGIYNKQVVAEYVELLNFFAHSDYKEELRAGNVDSAGKEVNEFLPSKRRKVVFLPQNINVARKVFAEVKDWLIYNRIAEKDGNHKVLKTLSAGFTVFNEDSVEEALEDFAKNLDAPHSRNIINSLSPIRNSLIIDGDEAYKRNYPFKDTTSLSGCGSVNFQHYYGEIDKNSLKPLFDEVLVRYPHLLALNEFMEHGKKSQNLKEYIATEAGKSAINKCLKNNTFNFYSHTKDLMCTLVAPKDPTEVNFLSLNFSANMQFVPEKVSTLSAQELRMWIENHKSQPYFDLSSPLKKSLLEDWIWQLSKPQKELDKEYAKLRTLKLKGENVTIGGLISSKGVSNWIQDNIEEELSSYMEDNLVKEYSLPATKRVQDFLEDRLSRCRYKNINFLFNTLLHQALENSKNKEHFNVSAFSYFIILDSILQTNEYMRSSSFNTFSAILYDTLKNVRYDLDKLAKVLYTLRTDRSLPMFTKKEWSDFLTSTTDISEKNSTELNLLLGIFTPHSSARNSIKREKLTEENWEFLRNAHRNKPLYLLKN